ncbi:MAG: hypothetical protein NUV69_02530 [Candidatus Curtissbacteria bacterium]|nr:hypothetical protein [Candidatus Curtissbacteria bacterium]
MAPVEVDRLIGQNRAERDFTLNRGEIKVLDIFSPAEITVICNQIDRKVGILFGGYFDHLVVVKSPDKTFANWEYVEPDRVVVTGEEMVVIHHRDNPDLMVRVSHSNVIAYAFTTNSSD